MKKDYLKELELYLDEYNVENKKDILKKYSKRYDFGLESGLNEEKIEEMLGNPKNIAQQYADIIDVDKIYDKDYEIIINLTTEDLIIKPSKDFNIHIELDDLEKDDYQIEKDDKHLFIKRSKNNYFGTKINGSIIIEIPERLKITKYDIKTISSDIELKEIYSEDLYLHTNNGDINVDFIQSDNIKIETVSGDFNSDNIKTKFINLETISGDFNISSIVSDELKAQSISGNININSAYVGKVTSNSVSGNILINGDEIGLNVKKSIKKTFNKIKKAIKND